MTHNMKLCQEPFNSIANGSKTIELRLNDEKRQKIAVGDTIVFNCLDNSDVISARVKALHKFKDFRELYSNLPLDECGYTQDELPTAHYTDMNAYYSDEQIEKYGVLGIEIFNVEAICNVKPDLLKKHIYSLLAPSVYFATDQKLQTRAQEYYNSPNTYVYTFLLDGEYAGIVVFSVKGSIATINDIAVKFEYTQKGIGRKLVMYILSAFTVDTIIAETDDDAVGFYKKIGFEISNVDTKFDINRYICTFSSNCT